MGSFFVLVNDEEHTPPVASLSRCASRLAAGYREADRSVCLDYIEQNWTDIRPASLREKSAARRGVDK
jgi:uncharacterized protein YbdZ (MbtH family)